MANFQQQLFIKYGLGTRPSLDTAARWTAAVQALISQGINPEKAGHAAAKQLFPDYQTHHYASEADSIEALLAAAAERAQRGG